MCTIYYGEELRDTEFTGTAGFRTVTCESKAKVIKFVQDVGMQVSEEITEVHPQVVVLMGGLTMPDVHISAEKALDHVSRYEPKIVGACYMSELFDAKWPDVIPFDLLVDGIIDPVYVGRKTG